MVFGVEKPPQTTLTKIGERDIIYTWLSKRALSKAARQRGMATQTSAYWHAQLGESCSTVRGMQALDEACARRAGYSAAGSVNAARGSPNRAQGAQRRGGCGYVSAAPQRCSTRPSPTSGMA